MNLDGEYLSGVLAQEARGLSHGIIRLEVHYRDGRPWRLAVSRERSILALSGEKCSAADESLSPVSMAKTAAAPAGMAAVERRNQGAE